MALVISRKSQRFNPGPENTFRIGDDVVITILAWGDGQVRIAIEAPRAVPVHREEVYQRIRQELPPGVPIQPHHRDGQGSNGY